MNGKQRMLSFMEMRIVVRSTGFEPVIISLEG